MKLEYELPEEGIVDKHALRDDERVVVEISITSNATRELEHIRVCLETGCERGIGLVFTEPI